MKINRDKNFVFGKKLDFQDKKQFLIALSMLKMYIFVKNFSSTGMGSDMTGSLAVNRREIRIFLKSNS
jgi:hypothetical protein